jgi:hypothetical protein
VARGDLDLGRDLVAGVLEELRDGELAHRGPHPVEFQVGTGPQFRRHLVGVLEGTGRQKRLVEFEGVLAVGFGEARGVVSEERPGRVPAVLREEHRQEKLGDVGIVREPGVFLVELGEQFPLCPLGDGVGHLLERVLVGAPERARRLGVAQPVGLAVAPGEQRDVAVVHLEAPCLVAPRLFEPRGPHRRADGVVQIGEQVAADTARGPVVGRATEAKRRGHTDPYSTERFTCFCHEPAAQERANYRRLLPALT